MTLKLMVDALTALHGRVYHLTAAKDAKPPYIVWASDSGSALWADNSRTEKKEQGTIDLYTKSDKDALIAAIPAARDTAEISFYLNSVQMEDDTGLIHYEWVYEVFS